MKSIQILSILLFSFCISTGMKCKESAVEPVPALPAETQSGKHTFGCLVNGEFWFPKGNFPYSSLTAFIQYDIFKISASQGNLSSFTFIIRDLNTTGEFAISDKVYASYFTKSEGDIPAKEGRIIITKLDEQNKIISGLFWLTIERQNSELIHITHGRFDLKYTN